MNPTAQLIAQLVVVVLTVARLVLERRSRADEEEPPPRPGLLTVEVGLVVAAVVSCFWL